MIEIVSIISLIFYFLFLSLFPLNSFSEKISVNSIRKYFLIDKLSTNIIININLLFILSLLKIDLLMIFYLQLVSGLIFFIYFLKSKKHFNFDDFILLKVVFIITFVLSLVVASKLSLGWDSDFRWIIKALNFVQGNNIDNLKNLVDPEYPYLGSLLWGFFWKISFLEYEYFGRLFYVYLFTLSLFSLTDILKIRFIYKCCFAVSLIFLGFDYIHFNGYQDIILFSIICFVSKILYSIFLDKKDNSKRLYSLEVITLILSFNILFWIKNEGMIYSFIFTILFLFFSNNYKQKIFLVSSVFFLFFLKYFIYQSLELPFLLQGETYNKSIFGFEYKVLFERFFLVSKYYLMFLLDNLLMLISLISLTIIVVFVKNPIYLKFFLLFFFLNLSFIYGSHLFMNLKNIDYWITHTIPRFMLQTTGFYLLAFLIFCNIRFSKFLK